MVIETIPCKSNVLSNANILLFKLVKQYEIPETKNDSSFCIKKYEQTDSFNSIFTKKL